MDLSFIPSLKPLYQPFLDRGYEIYLVGGAVRDLLLGGSPKDFDFTTNAEPESVLRMFRRTIPTGIKHGTVTVMLADKAYEVTTYRTETDYVDHRRPNEVKFTPSLEEDLKRRDFTINGLALSLPSGQVVDFHGGRRDLEAKIIRSIGRPSDRFEEDALRILRACRFAARFAFTLDSGTWEAVMSKKQDIRHLSRERVREELNKTTASAHPGYGWRLLRTAGLTSELGLSTDYYSNFPALEDLLDHQSELTLPSRWALILRLTAKTPVPWMKQMTFSNQEIKEVQRRLSVLDSLVDGIPSGGTGEVLWHWGSRNLDDLLLFLSAARSLNLLPPGLDTETFRQDLEKKAVSGEGVFLKDLGIQGEDVMAILNKKGGPWLGELLQDLLVQVWKVPESNTRESLEVLVRNSDKRVQSEATPKEL